MSDSSDSTVRKWIRSYDWWLRENPLLVKSITSGVIFGAGDAVAQLISPKIDSHGGFMIRSTLAFGGFGLVVSGPLIHYFYGYLDQVFPRGKNQWIGLVRVLIDRLLLAPPYLLLLFYMVPMIEGKGHSATMQKIRETFPDVMKMNIKIWTIFQYVNINFVPQRYRVLFMAMLSFLWNIYVAIKRR